MGSNSDSKGCLSVKIVRRALAGTLESCDVTVSVAPGTGGREIRIESPVAVQFSDEIHRAVGETLDAFEVTDVTVDVFDRGAFDFAIRARVEAAVVKAVDETC